MSEQSQRNKMAAFLSAQLDFIFFFYGLAFILLGGVCFAVVGIPGPKTFFGVLGVFAVAHGVGEWLDLIALLAGDTKAYAVTRTALMTGSFVFLVEFARRHATLIGLRVPGPWLYLPLLLLVLVSGMRGGVSAANAVARYTIGFEGAMATAWLFVLRAREKSDVPNRWWCCGAVGFALYGIAAGAVVPAAQFWPASVINYEWFLHLTRVPIQLVRGLIACWITTSLWMIWKRMVAVDVDSKRYTASQQLILVWTLVATGSILGLGWTLTEFLGGIYQHSVEKQSAGDINLLASLLDRETAILDDMVKALAGAPFVMPLLTGENTRGAGIVPNIATAQSTLDMAVAASGGKLAFVIDNSGTVVASSGGNLQQSPAPSYGLTAPRDSHFAPDTLSGSLDYRASRPVLTRDGTMVGTAVLTKSLDAFESSLSTFDRVYFLVDPDGVVMATNRPDMLMHPLWPLRQAKDPAARTLFDQDVDDATWINVHGERQFVRRRFAGEDHWSLVLVMPNSLIFANRFLGIIITLLVSIIMMIYLYGRERAIRDRIEMESRLNLREVAQGLELRATTDPLTGLYNRLKFNEALGREMARSKRHKTPFSLVLFDLDHFKTVNDTHGHQIGDAVLIQVTQLVSSHTRPTDLFARWGGEEFVILSPGSSGQLAYMAAERLRAAINQVMFEDAGTLSCSFGVAQYVDGDDQEAVMARADAALYRAKIGGRNRVELAS
jgi:diguanylate cyclase (GGDEF)-like protein